MYNVTVNAGFEGKHLNWVQYNKIAENLIVSPIHWPGVLHILSLPERSPGLDMANIIRDEDELRISIEIELFYVNKSWDIQRILGFFKVTDRCWELKMDCYDRDREMSKEHSVYLHQVFTAKERLEREKELWEVESLEI